MKINVRKLITAVLLSLAVTFTAAEVTSYALPFTTVYITRPGTRYHRRSCLAVRQGPIAISLSKAQSLGFIPCQRCKPPTW